MRLAIVCAGPTRASPDDLDPAPTGWPNGRVKEFVYFLGGQPPYDSLDLDDLERLADSVEAEYVPAGAEVVTEGQDPLQHLWVVRTGSVEVLDHGRVIDQLHSGDTFGQVSLFSGERPTLTVRALEDCLVYRLNDPRSVVSRPERLRFAAYGSLVQRGRVSANPTGLRDRALMPVGTFGRPLVRCAASETVAEVAARIEQDRQSCAVITFPDGFGIVTDADFRKQVGTGQVSPHAEIGVLATRPALSVPEDTPLATAFLEMVERGVHHLLLTDGAELPTGVVRVVDLASAEVRDPLVVRAAIDSATSMADLAHAVALLPGTAVELFDAAVPPVRIGALLSAVLDSVLRRLLILSPMNLDVQTSWIVLGSLARREVLPTSDVDTALAWDDPPEGTGDIAAQVRQAASGVLDDLEKTGLRRCADGANADNARFSRSLSGWRQATVGWLRDAGQDSALLLSTMLADSRPISSPDLGQQVTDALMATGRTPQFLRMLLEYTLSSRPPTGFVRDFVVEHSGEHRGQLNLKRGGLRPVTSLGRWVAVVTGDVRGTTPERLRRAADAKLLSLDESETLIGAHEQIYGLLLEMEVEALRSGTPVSTYIAPGTLDSLTRRHLRESFRAIAGVQSRLESNWQGQLPGMST